MPPYSKEFIIEQKKLISSIRSTINEKFENRPDEEFTDEEYSDIKKKIDEIKAIPS